MSRIGRKPINIPAGVEAKFENGVITVKGPKGTLTQKIHPNMAVEINGAVIEVKRPDDEKLNRSLHGLSRTIIHNMIVGVTEGYKKELEVNGVGYRVQKQGKKLVMNIGYSHQVIMEDTEDITIEVPNPNSIIIHGIDKQKVGQFAAEVREKRPPEPYKGKGIKYAGEYIRRKEGKPDSKAARVKRHKRVRGKLSGTAECPRLCVFRSTNNIYAQIIDDVKGVTLCSASSLDKTIEGGGNNHGRVQALAEGAREGGLNF